MTNDAGILLVEDDTDLREALAEFLADEGFGPVDTAANGAEALRKLHDGPPPGVILLDLMMPVMDGWAFRRAQLADSQLAPIPVVVLSAADSLPDVSASLRKPVDLDALSGVLRRLLA